MLRFRSYLLWLMMLALPLQGLAAASMVFCGMGATHGSTLAQVLTSSAQQQKGASAQHDHAMHHMAAPAVEKSPGIQAQLPVANHACGVCAACSSVIGIVDSTKAMAAQASPRIDLAEPFILIHAVPSHPLDRPPRA